MGKSKKGDLKAGRSLKRRRGKRRSRNSGQPQQPADPRFSVRIVIPVPAPA